MTLLVIQEQHFTQSPNGDVWVNETSNSSFWDRYLNVFENIIVCARMDYATSNTPKGLMKSSRPEVQFVGLPNFRGTGGMLKHLFEVRKTIAKALSMADCVIYRAPSPISFVAYPVILKSKKPFAVELMNNPITQFSKQSMNSIFQPLILKMMVSQTKDMCAKANGVSYVTERELQKLFPCEAMLHPESHHFTGSYSTIKLNAEDYCFKEMSDELPDPVVLIHSGKMNDKRKGQDLLIKAIRILQDKGYNVVGKFIGDGILRTEFENLAISLGLAESVAFEGWKTGYSEVQKVLQTGNIFVFPSLGEGLPRSVIEAMANGILPIASDVDGIKELIPKDLQVPAFSEYAFAECIQKVIDHWSEYNQKRNEIFEYSKKYEDSKLVAKRTEFYKKLKQASL